MYNETVRQHIGALVIGGLLALAVVLALVLAVPAHAAFGVQGFDGQLTANAEGGAYTQAGGHPYSVVTEIEFNHHVNPDLEFLPFNLVPDEPAKDVLVDLPAGLVGNPGVAEKCTSTEIFGSAAGVGTPGCQLGSQVGTVVLNDAGIPLETALFNMQAPPSVPARFGFNVLGTVVSLDARVRSGGDYGLSVDTHGISEALPIVGIQLTIWGTPADPSHDGDRCLGFHSFVSGSPFCTGTPGDPFFGPNSAGRPAAPFMTLPTRCTAPGEGLRTDLRVDSWNNPGVFAQASFLSHEPPNFPLAAGERGPVVGVTGCDAVPFTPSIQVTPSTSAPNSPSGLDVSLSIPTEGLENTVGLAQSQLKKAVVRLPQGLAVNPGAADGLAACSEAQVGLHDTGPSSCPDASKVGSVEIHTPLLAAPLEGSIFLASQGANPFGSVLAGYVVVEGSGVRIKLAGRIDTDPLTGQVTATFDDAPQLPFSEFKLSFFNGPRAVLSTPVSCGTYTTDSVLTGYSGSTVAFPSSFQVGGASGACPAGGSFSPSFLVGTINPHAGGFSPMVLRLGRSDSDEALAGLSFETPPGLAGILASVPLCSDARAAAGTCGQESLVGHIMVGAGVGSHQVYVPGEAFLTGSYHGAPFGLSLRVPIKAGPFDLGVVALRGTVAVDPHTAQLTITPDPLPTIISGIPLDIRVVNVEIDRPGFMFNPTSCAPQVVTGTVTSAQGTRVSVSSRFQAADCAALPFAPRFTASSPARTSRQNGAALDVKVGFPKGEQANIGRVAVVLPKQLPARLSTVQQACPAATFEANPAACNEGSMVGVGTAVTPTLNVPLTGPAYLVSHGGESFPDIVLVLQAQGVTIQLVGNVFISKAGITSATFAHVPDAPISAFDLSLPMGPHSALSAVGSLCAGALNMPTTITGQNGAVVKQTTRIKVAGCPKAKKKPKKHKKKHKKRGAKKGNAARRS